MRNDPSLEANLNIAALRAYVGHFLNLSSVIVLLTQVVARCPQVEEGTTYPLECAYFFDLNDNIIEHAWHTTNGRVMKIGTWHVPMIPTKSCRLGALRIFCVWPT